MKEKATVEVRHGDEGASIKLNRRLPPNLWQQMHRELKESGFRWNQDNQSWTVENNTKLVQDALNKLEETWLELDYDEIVKTNQDYRKKMNHQWMESESQFLKDYEPEVHKKVEDAVQSLPDTKSKIIDDESRQEFISDLVVQAQQFIPSGINQKAFIKSLRTALCQLENIENYDLQSIRMAVFMAAGLGLEPDNQKRECYFLPFDDKVQLVLGYHGLISLSVRTGEVLFFDAHCVHKQDRLILTEGEYPTIAHYPHINPEIRGEIVQAYAICVKKSGEKVIYIMSEKDIKRARQLSPTKNLLNTPWDNWTREMILKSCLKSLIKKMELSPEKKSSKDS